MCLRMKVIKVIPIALKMTNPDEMLVFHILLPLHAPGDKRMGVGKINTYLIAGIATMLVTPVIAVVTALVQMVADYVFRNL